MDFTELVKDGQEKSRQEAGLSSVWNLVQEYKKSLKILECELRVMF